MFSPSPYGVNFHIRGTGLEGQLPQLGPGNLSKLGPGSLLRFRLRYIRLGQV